MLVVVPLDVSMNAAIGPIGHSACGACELTREFSQPESHRNLLDELMNVKLRHDMAVSIR